MKYIKPLVSIIVPSYNHKNYIQECIEHIYAQTYKNIELIVIDDGSPDDSVGLLKVLSNKYGFTFIARQNKGLVYTINEGLDLSLGEYVCIVASDDVLRLNAISELVGEFLKLGSDYAVVHANADIIDADGRVKQERISRFEGMYDEHLCVNNYKLFLSGNHIIAPSTMIRKSTIYSHGKYDHNSAIEDLDMWLKLSKDCKFSYIDKVVSSYRKHDKNTDKTGNIKMLDSNFYLYKREKEYCIEKSLYDEWLGIITTLFIVALKWNAYGLIFKYRSTMSTDVFRIICRRGMASFLNSVKSIYKS